MTHEHDDPPPFFKNPKLVIPIVIICTAVALYVFGKIAVDAFLSLMQLAATTGAAP